MVTELLSKITGVFKSDFLFASLLPALLFWVVVAATLSAVVGLGAVWEWADELGDQETAGYTAVATLALVVFAYLLNALRVPFRLFWSGQVSLLGVLWVPLRLGEAYQRWRYRRLDRRVKTQPVWVPILEDFKTAIELAGGPSPLQGPDLKGLRRNIGGFRRDLGAEEIQRRLGRLVEAIGEYGSGKTLSRLQSRAEEALEDWAKRDERAQNKALFKLDRGYGDPMEVAATDLGNVIASYDRYAYTRYKIESKLFWPRLATMLSTDLRSRIEDRTVLLDFSLTTATLMLIYGVCGTVFGPLLWSSPARWMLLGLASVAVAYLFYRLGVSTARQLGHLVRTAFDLHRLDLMKGFGLPRPKDFREELTQWEKLSQLVVYGEETLGPRLQFELSEEGS